MTRLMLSSSLAVVALFGLGSLAGCDSLWLNYTKPDPASCTSRTPPCDDGFICNPSSGVCVSEDSVTPLVFRDVSPKWLPMNGGPILIQGSGFQYGNISSSVRVADIQTTNTTVVPDKIVTTAPAGRTLCTSVPLQINRSDGFYQTIDNAIFYRFEPYTISQSIPMTGSLGKIDQFQAGQLDLDDPRMDFLFKYTTGGFGVIPNESNIILKSPDVIPFVKVVPGYFTLTGKNSNAAGTTDDSFYIYSKDSSNNIIKTGTFLTSKKFIKDAITLDIDPIKQDRDELILLNSDPANGSFIFAYKIRAENSTNFNITASYVLSLDYSANAVTTFRSSSSGAIDRLLISGTANNPRIPGVATDRGFYQLITFSGDFTHAQYITDPQLPSGIASILASDLDQDGRPEIIGYSQTTGNVYITTSASNYTTSKTLRAYSLSTNRPVKVNLQVTDANCDGTPDLFISDPTGAQDAIIHYNNTNDFSPDPVGLVQMFSGQSQKVPYALALFPFAQNQIPGLLYTTAGGLYLGQPSFQKP